MGKGGDKLARGYIPELPAISAPAVRIRAPSGLNAPYALHPSWAKEAMSLPEAASQSLAVVSQPVVKIRAPSGLKAARDNLILMGKRGEELARGCIPELGGLIRACRQDSSTVRTECRVAEFTLMLKVGDELARGCIPELGPVYVSARCQDPSTIQAKHRVKGPT